MFAPKPSTSAVSAPTISSVPKKSKRPFTRSCGTSRSAHHVATSAISVTGTLIQNSARQSGAAQFKPSERKKSTNCALYSLNSRTMMPP